MDLPNSFDRNIQTRLNTTEYTVSSPLDTKGRHLLIAQFIVSSPLDIGD
jgi:hypothetical protein